MARRRVDVCFSNKDNALWDILETIEKGDRGYWLKHYATIGISVLGTPIPTVHTIPMNLTENVTTGPIVPTSIHTVTKTPRKNNKLVTTTAIPEKVVQSTIQEVEARPDPLAKRRAAMGNLVQADSDIPDSWLDKSEQIDLQENPISNSNPTDPAK